MACLCQGIRDEVSNPHKANAPAIEQMGSPPLSLSPSGFLSPPPAPPTTPVSTPASPPLLTLSPEPQDHHIIIVHQEEEDEEDERDDSFQVVEDEE